VEDTFPSSVDVWLAQALRTSTEHAVMVLSPAGIVVAWLGACERVFGYAENEAVGMDFGVLFTPEDRGLGLDRQEIAQAANSGRSEDDRWHVRKDGSLFWGSGILGTLRHPDGSVSGFCKVLRDRTDLRAQLDALRNRVLAQEEEQRRRTHFLVSLGHELRNPLGTLHNAVSLACNSADPVLKEKACSILGRQVAVMVRLLDDLTQATQAAVGKLQLQVETVIVQEALEDAANSIRPAVQEKGQHLLLTLPPVPFTIEADPARLQQMLLNLVGNASKFTPPGGHIHIGVTVEAGMAVIRVQDDGIGISAEILPHIFDLFTRGETQDSVPGLGVGLAVVKELATLHGGGVEVRSPGTGKGSVFALRLPLSGP
jgi:PAS domain S-box-containing protein